ncbi:hypothetical protein K469DRAFT_165897 [Zopfia rhizophila CBS 207.26]|uniref:Uncharacterized protein n=1 Tax=Zopfia rhizophila CBS 207.26 TaxID=1314779 RepID=A0A6A6E257_9PEZI|nr:hypothetical protein K469DRAFT_165897 [Zopfia rhizophila CBS 207.26]
MCCPTCACCRTLAAMGIHPLCKSSTSYHDSFWGVNAWRISILWHESDFATTSPSTTPSATPASPVTTTTASATSTTTTSCCPSPQNHQERYLQVQKQVLLLEPFQDSRRLSGLFEVNFVGGRENGARIRETRWGIQRKVLRCKGWKWVMVRYTRCRCQWWRWRRSIGGNCVR